MIEILLLPISGAIFVYTVIGAVAESIRETTWQGYATVAAISAAICLYSMTALMMARD